MTLDTFSVQCFIAVSETGSFTKAAKQVRRTQPAVSQQIAKLEEILGESLFLRGKALQLTPQGEVFLGYARKILKLQCEALDRFKEPQLLGDVRFGLPEDFASLFLSDVLANFSRIHPRISLNIECDLTLTLFDRFKKKEFDLVLVKMNKPEDFPNGVNVWSEPLRWVGDPSLIEENAPIPLVLAPYPCVYRASAIRALEESGKTWKLVFISPSYTGIAAAVKARMGITVMPSTMIPNHLEAIPSPILPKLTDTHVSLLKHQKDLPSINTLEEFVINKLRH
jgi:DNA-binding transcriptional LysR family regulator